MPGRDLGHAGGPDDPTTPADPPEPDGGSNGAGGSDGDDRSAGGGADVPRRRRDRVLHTVPVLLVLVLLAAGVAGARFDLGERWLGWHGTPPVTPAAIAPPPGLDLPAPEPPEAVAAPATDASLDAGAVRRALARGLRDRDLGKHVLAVVQGLGDPRPTLEHGAGAATPASTMKLLTTTAALEALGPQHTFTTRVVAAGGSGRSRRIVLVGGGDPFLSSRPVDEDTYPRRADVVTLARRTARQLHQEGVRSVRLDYDDSLFSGPRVDPHWPDHYVPEGVVAPITALWVDEGRPASGYGRVADPSLAAAQTFAAALRRTGLRVSGEPRAHRAPPQASPVAEVVSPPLGEIVERVLTVSDNEGAEVLGHHVGLATGHAGSFTGGVRGVEAVLRELGVPLERARITDGSGLSRQDRLDPDTLAGVLAVAASEDHPELRSVVTGLPVAGFTGSLEDRFDQGDPAGRGRVRAKTGTLSGVSSLAGVATDLDGDTMVFALMADAIALPDTLDARAALDGMAAALGACHCRAEALPDAGTVAP